MAISALLLIIVLNSFSSYAAACTIFSASNGETTLVANNEDWSHTNFSILFYPKNSQGHGYAAFTHSEHFEDIRTGMNDQGVFIGSTLVPPSNVTPDPDIPYLNRDLFRYVLRTCASVNDSIDLFMQYNIADVWEWQILVADRFGESVVIVAGPDKTIQYIRKNATYQLITNGNIAYPELGQSSSSVQRYHQAKVLLEQIGSNITIANARDVLDAARSVYTAFSCVYDLVNRDLYVYFNHNFSKEVVLHLDNELKKGWHSFVLRDLFRSTTTTNLTETLSLTVTETST